MSELINTPSEIPAMPPIAHDYKLRFRGEGTEYFGILIVNWLLTIVTLGFYYPWAKERELKFLYKSASLNNEAFTFHGTGKEMFIGFIKAIAIFILLYAILFGFIYIELPVVGLILFNLALFLIIPLAIHGSTRYRMSRSSWRGIRFGYRGDRNEFIKKFLGWFGLTLITLGIYGSWFTVNIRNYILGHTRFGNLSSATQAKESIILSST